MSAFRWTDAEVRRALGLPAEGGAAGEPYEGVSTDSRTLAPGQLYVALSGERFDGHEFVAAALAAGARGAVVSRGAAGSWQREEEDGSVRFYRVDDTLVALGQLASHRRAALGVPVVGITGSSGKTSTKELTAAALGGALRVHATKGNLNNRVGVPLTLLATPDDAQVVVAEMGTNEPGEIATLGRIGRPDVGVVTTVGESHLEGLGSLEGVLREKLSLLETLGGTRQGLVGDTPPMLPEAARQRFPGVRVAGWSERADPDLRPQDPTLGEQGAWTFTWKGERVALAMPGRHAVSNALLALAVAEALGVSPADAVAGLASARAGWMRGEVRRLGGLTLLLDCYNANPQSVKAAIDVLTGWKAPRRVAVLGSMLELGPESEALHRRVLAEALASDVDLVVASGQFARAAEELPGGARLVAAEEPAEAFALARPRLAGDEVVLLKGSRGVALERLVPLFEAEFGSVEGEG